MTKFYKHPLNILIGINTAIIIVGLITIVTLIDAQQIGFTDEERLAHKIQFNATMSKLEETQIKFDKSIDSLDKSVDNFGESVDSFDKFGESVYSFEKYYGNERLSKIPPPACLTCETGGMK